MPAAMGDNTKKAEPKFQGAFGWRCNLMFFAITKSLNIFWRFLLEHCFVQKNLNSIIKILLNDAGSGFCAFVHRALY